MASGVPAVPTLDGATGLVTVSTATTFDELLRFLVPRGWFVPVTPGTRQITRRGRGRRRRARQEPRRRRVVDGSRDRRRPRPARRRGAHRVAGRRRRQRRVLGDGGRHGPDRCRDRLHVPGHPDRDEPDGGRHATPGRPGRGAGRHGRVDRPLQGGVARRQRARSPRRAGRAGRGRARARAPPSSGDPLAHAAPLLAGAARAPRPPMLDRRLQPPPLPDGAVAPVGRGADDRLVLLPARHVHRLEPAVRPARPRAMAVHRARRRRRPHADRGARAPPRRGGATRS